jgi:hypothetical protein
VVVGAEMVVGARWRVLAWRVLSWRALRWHDEDQVQKQEEWLGGRQKSLAPAANHYVCMQTHANTRQHTACHSRLPTGPASPQVETLGLGWCKVGNGPGVKAVADMLMYNQTIRRLDLRGNGLGNDGARAGRRGFCGLAWRVAGCCCCCPSRSYSPAGAI